MTEFNLDSFIDSTSWQQSDNFDPKLAEEKWRDELKSVYLDQLEEKTRIRDIFAGNAAFIALCGSEGTGKRLLVERLQSDKHLFVRGRYDMLRRAEAFPGMVAALNDLAHTLQQENNENQNAYLKRSLQKALGHDLSMLTSLVPALARIVGDEKDTDSDQQVHSYNRILFVSAMRAFLAALLRYGRKVVLYIENIHFAASNEALSVITQSLHDKGLRVIVTVDLESREIVERLGERFERDRIPFQMVPVPNLSEQDIVVLVPKVLPISKNKEQALARDLFRLSEGIPIFVLEYVGWMISNQILNQALDRRSWTFEENDLLLFDIPDTLNLLRRDIPDDLEEVLKVASCLGPVFRASELEAILEFPVDDLLEEGINLRVLNRVDNDDSSFQFSDDIYQQAMYRLMQETNSELAQLEIGRRLWRKSERRELDWVIYKVLHHLAAGSRLITRPNEKEAVAYLALQAAAKTAKSSAFGSASFFVNLGLSLLDKRSWKENYDLTLALHNTAAEVEMASANFEQLDLIVRDIRAKSRTFEDSVRSIHAQMYSYVPRGRALEAFELGIDTLHQLGVPFPRSSSIPKILLTHWKTERLLKNVDEKQIGRFGPLRSQTVLDALLTLQLMTVTAFLFKPELFPMIAMKQVELTVKHGLSVMSPNIVAGYAITHLALGRDYERSYKYAKLAMNLSQEWGRHEHQPGTVNAIYGAFWYWKRPFHECPMPLNEAFYVGIQTGDVQSAAISASAFFFTSLEAGTPLPAIRNSYVDFAKIIRLYRQESLLGFIEPTVQLVHHFLGLSENPLASKGDILDWNETYMEMKASREDIRALEVTINRMIVCYFFKDYGMSGRCANEGLREAFKYPPTANHVIVAFYGALSLIEVAREGSGVPKARRITKQSIRRFKKWSLLCPSNFLDKLYLLEAELASLNGRNDEAYAKYLSAIAMARESSLLSYIALANEKCGHHLYRIGEKEDALKYFTDSVSAYSTWGATAKVSRLQLEIGKLFQGLRYTVRDSTN